MAAETVEISGVIRRVPIRLRVVMAVAVPLLLVIGLAGVSVRDSMGVRDAAEAELERIDAIAVLSSAQASNFLPELGQLRLDLQEDGQQSTAQNLVLAATWDEFIDEFLVADDVRRSLPARTEELMGPEAMAAFAAQRASIEAMRIEVATTGSVRAETVNETFEARRRADNALQVISLDSATDAWVVYADSSRTIRVAAVEAINVVPALLGINTSSPQGLSDLANQRETAVAISVDHLDPARQAEVEAILRSEEYRRWLVSIETARRVRSDLAEPASFQSAAQATLDAGLLEAELKSIAARAVQDERDQLLATAADADQQRRWLTSLAVSISLASIMITVWILRSITSPLRELSDRAAAVAAGQIGTERHPVEGADELSRLGVTIEDTADGLRHLEVQVRALTSGHLDDPSLETAAPGAVGAFIQQRIEALRHANDRLRLSASQDPLTGLLNRRGLIDAIRGITEPSAVLYIDLDGFKAINDVHGHNHGDHVLQTVGTRLEQFAREGDLVARFGGDEFVLVLARAIDSYAEARFIERLERQLSERFEIDGVEHEIGASIGIDMLEVDGDLDASLHRADRAMFARKDLRRGRLRGLGEPGADPVRQSEAR